MITVFSVVHLGLRTKKVLFTNDNHFSSHFYYPIEPINSKELTEIRHLAFTWFLMCNTEYNMVVLQPAKYLSFPAFTHAYPI